MNEKNQQQMKKPVDWDELYPGRFIKAGELNGKKVTLTISDVDTEELVGDKGPKVKGIISFERTPKKLALNRTNGTCLREMFGRKLSDWVGKRVVLYPAEWNGEPCIRIWGSPDIERDMSIEVALPRRRPTPMVMRSTKQQQPVRRQQADEHGDPEPGAGDEP